MTEQTTEPTSPTPPPAGDPWKEVGKQFQILGESLATAFRTSLESEENRRHVQEMKAGVESMVKEVSQAIKDTATSPQSRQVRDEAEKTAHSLREASQQTVQQVRPHLVSALRQVNEELQKMIERLEHQRTAPDVTPAEGVAEEAPGVQKPE